MTRKQYQYSRTRRDSDSQLLSDILDQCDAIHRRSLLRHQDSLSGWLTVLPVQKDNLNLTAAEFRDALCLRYLKPLLDLPTVCDGCGAPFTTSHALDCMKGGLIVQRHNEIRDLLFDLMSIVWSHTVKEPVVQEGDPESHSGALVADISARGVWQPQTTALFDVRVVDSDAPSYLSKPPAAVLRTAERDKKSKYSLACERRHASFTPLCLTIDGLVAPEMSQLMKRLADRLALKWDLNYNVTINWLRSKLSIALLRATNLCIRGSRTKWRGLAFEDGGGIITNNL